MEKDLYQILGVKKEASEAEIRKAYLKLAKKHHPDVNPGNKEAEQRFKEVNLAYEVLKDKKKRAQYDQLGAMGGRGGREGAWRTGSAPFGPDIFGDLGLGDLFQEIFGGDFRGGGTRFRTHGQGRSSFAQRGSDQETSIEIPFLEAARGGNRVLGLSDGRQFTVKIPPGVENGSKIKLSGQGGPGFGGGERGDLIITVRVQPHPVFKREGLDLIMALPITFTEAVLGAEVQVPTLDGKVHMKIPPGVSSGQRLRLAGKGIRSQQGDRQGDQYVELLIKIPKRPDSVYVEAAQKLRSSEFQPRD